MRIQWIESLHDRLIMIMTMLLAAGTLFLPLHGNARASHDLFQNGNLTYDLSRVYDRTLRTQILAALDLGHRRASAGKLAIAKEISDLRGTGQVRVIRFFSDEREASPNGVSIGAPAFAIWRTPYGELDQRAAPSARTDLRVYIRPHQPYWYLVNTVWHELLHFTLRKTHQQTTRGGTMPPEYVDNSVWYPTIRRIMLDFPRNAVDPISGRTIELYNPENNPWS